MFVQKNFPLRTIAPKSVFDTVHEPLHGWFRYLIVDSSPVLPASQQATMLHHPQMLGGHVAGNLASLGNLPNRQFAPKHQLHHPKSHRMRQRSQALSSLLKILQVDQLGSASCFHASIIS